ncbi:MAG: hypothetical protein IPJ79_07435 [Bacteroidetes bacterium]|nr:hypothetical protein [Bacteroidota bacterium]HNR20971.1 hypothetical protein [Bacteroidia bacterium]HNU32815.1 hypothetical protein [Bacteroidia bacterium]
MSKKFFLALLLLTWLTVIGYYMLPLKKPINYHPYIQDQSILATQQFCSGSCADVLIKQSKVLISDSLRRIYPKLRSDIANLKGETPFKQKHGRLMYSYDFILFGKFVGVDTTLQEGIVPVYYVKEWYPTQYIARFWQLKGVGEVIYLALLYLGLPLILYFSLKLKKSLSDPKV